MTKKILRSFVCASAMLFSLNGFAATDCPKDFKQFTDRFRSDMSFYISHINFPVITSDGKGTPERTSQVTRAQMEQFAKEQGNNTGISPSDVEKTNKEAPLGFRYFFIGKAQNGQDVMADVTNAHGTVYYFKRTKDCWMLEQVDDMFLNEFLAKYPQAKSHK